MKPEEQNSPVRDSTWKPDQDLKQLVKDLTYRELNTTGVDDVEIKPDVDEYGDPVLFIRIVLLDNHHSLKARETLDLTRKLWARMIDEGEEAFPVVSFVPKSELEIYKIVPL